ncbi:MAG: EamA family transporter [Gemmatimonadaceae bacterium]
MTATNPSHGRVIAAFAAVYVIWGSTYLGIRIAIETIPPFLMGGVRFLMAGAILYAWSRSRGDARPTPRNWLAATIVGGLLLLGGNGAVMWAEQYVATGIVSLLVAMVPLWIVLFEWIGPRKIRPTAGVALGVALGLVGLAVLAGPALWGGKEGVDPASVIFLMLGSMSWAAGSLYSRRSSLPSSSILAMGMEMLGGGALLLIFGLLSGELPRLDIGAISGLSLFAMAYLVVFGSLIGFTAYIWLLRVQPAARVSTYAYVNPIVAVFLGWVILAEPVSRRTLFAGAIIVASVALITTTGRGGEERGNLTSPGDSVTPRAA